MTLEEYLKHTKLSCENIKVITGLSLRTIYKIRYGFVPRLRTAKKIVRATKGMVSLQDIIPSKPSSPQSETSSSIGKMFGLKKGRK